jgi:hypothetical protein
MMEQPTEQGEAHRNKLQNYRNVNSRRRGKANQGEYRAAKDLFRIQENKIQNLGIMLLAARDPMYNNDELTVIRENAEITETAVELMSGVGLHYYTAQGQTLGVEFGDYNRAEIAIAAELYSNRDKAVIMGARGTSETFREVDPDNVKTWTIRYWLDFFNTTEEGRAIVAKNPGLQRMLQHVAMGTSYEANNRRYDRVVPVQLSDPLNQADFREAWSQIIEMPMGEQSEVNYPKEFAEALVTYEAARSGWRRGRDTFTSMLPSQVVKNLEVGRVMNGSEIAAVQAVNPNIKRAYNERNAVMSNEPMVWQGTVYINIPGGGRGKVTLKGMGSKARGFRGAMPMSEIAASLESTQEEVKLRREDFIDEKRNKSKEGKGRNEKNISQKVAILKERFRQNGIEVEVILDPTMDEAGDVVWDGETGTIRLHPNKLKGDTPIHEFAHIYVEILGYDHPTVQAVLKELRGTELYKEIEALYPELDRVQLEKEVLVTAIGIEGDKVFYQVAKPKSLRTRINQFFRKIAELLGIKQSGARQMFFDMMDSSQSFTAANLDTFRAQQRISQNLEIKSLLTEVSDEIANRINHMRRLGATTEEQKDILEQLNVTRSRLRYVAGKGVVAGLGVLTTEIGKVIRDTATFIEMGEAYVRTTIGEEFTEQDNNFFNQLYQLSQVLTTFEQAIEAFDVYSVEEAQMSPEVANEFRTQNRAFQGMAPRVANQLKQLDKLAKAGLSKKLVSNSTNPQVKAAMEAGLDIFSLANTDFGHLTKDVDRWSVQFFGIMDLEQNAVLGLFGKTIRNVINTQEMLAKNDIEELKQVLAEAEAKGVALENLIDEDGHSFVATVKGSFHAAAGRAKNRSRWLAANMEMEYLPEYYLNYLYAPDNAEIAAFRDEIAQYEEAVKNRTATPEEIEKLAEMKEQLPEMELTKKNWSKYHEAVFDMETYKKDRLNAKKEGPEALRLFDQAFTFVGKKGKSRPRFNTKYHKGNRVKPQFKNPKWTGTNAPKKQWLNDKAALLTADELETIDKLQTIMRRALGNSEHTMFEQNLLPQIVTPQGLAEGLGKFMKNVKRDLTTLQENNERSGTDAKDRKIYLRGDISSAHRTEEAISTDLKTTIAEFIMEARAAQASNTIETFSLLTRDQLGEMELTGRGGIKLSIKKGKRDKSPSTIKGERSNSMEAIEHVLEGYLGNGWEDSESGAAAASRLLQYTSFMGIGLNPRAWVSNLLYGEVMQILDAVGGDQYSMKSLGEAAKMVSAHVLDLAISRDKGKEPRSKMAAVMHYFDATMDQRELPEGTDWHNRIMDWAYIGQNFGEMFMQSQVVTAMLLETVVIQRDAQGKEIGRTNLFEALQWTPELGRGIKIPPNHYILRKDGTEVLMTVPNLAAFKTKATSVLQRIHGAYNSEDMGRFHRVALGRMALQFRKWMPMALKKRFAGDTYNEAREVAEYGYYRAVWDMLFGNLARPKDAKFYRYLATYNSQPPHIQSAIKRGLREIAMSSLGFAISALLASMIEIDGDDDDEVWIANDEFYKATLLFHVDRLAMEIASFTPWGLVDTALKIGKDPTASLRQLTALYNVLEQVARAVSPFHDMEVFKGGRNYGDLKFQVYIRRLIPVLKHWDSLADAVESHAAYHLH